VLAATAAALLSACNEAGDVDFSEATVANCLKEGGAEFAESVDELGFYSKASMAEEVSGAGYIHDDEVADLVINVWTEESDGKPPEWIVWVAQPYLQHKRLEQIVDTDPPRSYVAYAFRPSPSNRRQLESCAGLPPQ